MHNPVRKLSKLFALALLGIIVKSSVANEKPNIVLYLADDFGYGSVGAYGADPAMVRTPNLDELAEEGMRFDNAYTTGSVCSPTRYAMLTSQYSWRTYMKSAVVNPGDPMLLKPGQLTIASWLKERGYQTSHFGKWHLGYGDKKGSTLLDSMHTGPNKVGFDYHFGVPNNMDDLHKVYVENDSIYGLRSDRVSTYGRSYYGKPYIGYDAPQRNEPQVMETTTEKAIEWIDNRDEEKPFFMYFAAVAVHHPIMPSDRMRGTSSIGAYGDFIHDLDYSVGQLMNALKTRGLAENTIFIFSSDNGGDIPTNRPYSPENQAVDLGFKPNGDHRGDKHQVYNGGFRVPMMVRWPGKVQEESVVDGRVSTIDIFPTIADVLGESLNKKKIDGASFGSLLLNPKTDYEREELVLRDVKGRRALVSGNFKYITDKHPESVKKAPEVEEELYDLENDPGETKNLASSMPELTTELRKRLKKISRGD
ncbi:sulfatase family protein [Pelagicoccus mobilis]|uniref:Sulfatase-like hydrolase/transferase n=1 Tax=Pelagicoccus mobilis TaxID=415221 RepID=A0A934VQ38_9BACT|nr:arylsulfatase [Pelagicoccus mobilis]MBK1876485.1 sulfatase-like hydrolase/transferase [Pelagicoccus mobilis]